MEDKAVHLYGLQLPPQSNLVQEQNLLVLVGLNISVSKMEILPLHGSGLLCFSGRIVVCLLAPKFRKK